MANGRQRAVRTQEAELSEPVPLEGESAEEGGLSRPVPLEYAPPEIAAPKQGKPTQLATARLLIALCSIVILTFVVVASFVTLWLSKSSIDNLTRVLEIVFAPLVALVAAAVAFYYRGSSL